MKKTMGEWLSATTVTLTEARPDRYYTAFCPICGEKETAMSVENEDGKGAARGKTASHIESEHKDRIETEEAHQARLKYLEELRKAIKATHGCDAAHQDRVPVCEVLKGKTAWEGEVEIFVIAGHTTAHRCFAWGVRRGDDKGWDVTAVLSVPPIATPQLAVKTAIVAHARQAKPPR
jgi:hypothetical protein